MVIYGDQNMAELNFRVVVLGLFLSIIMGAANVYLGLKAGMTVSASIPAAVIASLFLRKFFRNGTILEANQVQTGASAGESLAAGIIFTMPALLMIGAWSHFDWLMTTAISLAGGLLGILFMIPMRRIFIVSNDNSELKYPEGIACAEVLRTVNQSSDDATSGTQHIIRATLLGGLFKLLSTFVPLVSSTVEISRRFFGTVFFAGADLSPALLAVGYIVGLEVASLVFIGGAIGWFIELPILSIGADLPIDAAEASWKIWSEQVRYTGVGAMVVGGVASLWKVRQGLISAIIEIKSTFSSSMGAQKDRQDIHAKHILALIMIATLITAAVYFELTSNLSITALTTVIMIAMSFFFTAVASYIVGLVGNSNSPVSGMTITAVLLTGLILTIFGFTGMEGMIATIGVAAIVCCAACTSGDVCNDLKTGAILGASPRRQQIMQILGITVAAMVMAPILQLLHDYTPGGIGGRELSAPQAALFANLARGFFGDQTLPWNLISFGALLGVGILYIDRYLIRKDLMRAHLMPIAVGMYLPLGLSVPIFLGGIIAHLTSRNQRASQSGVLFASGLIAGESLMGVGIAVLAAFGLARLQIEIMSQVHIALTVVAIIIVLKGLVKAAKPAP
jgi:putative OPT family oligopeptide transporter